MHSMSTWFRSLCSETLERDFLDGVDSFVVSFQKYETFQVHKKSAE